MEGKNIRTRKDQTIQPSPLSSSHFVHFFPGKPPDIQ